MIKFKVYHGIILALVGFMIFILILIFSIEKDQENFELIENDYYNKSIHHQEIINAQNNANSLAVTPEMNFTDEGFVIIFPDSLKIIKGNIELIRPSSKKLDLKVPLNLNSNKSMIIPAKLLKKGLYLVRLTWEDGRKNYNITKNIEWK